MNVRDRLAAIVAALPDGSAVQLPVDVVRAWLEEEEPTPELSPIGDNQPETSWRERLWTVPADQRLNVREVAESRGRGVDWVYRATSAKLAKAKGRAPLPCSRLDGMLSFRAGDVRAWLQASEEVVVPARLRACV